MSISKFLATCASVSTMTRDEFTEKFCNEYQNDSEEGVSVSKLVESLDKMEVDGGIKSLVNGILNMNDHATDNNANLEQLGIINAKIDALVGSVNRLNSNLENLLEKINK